jgi:Glycosyl transferase family 2/Glycosyltransferase family 87
MDQSLAPSRRSAPWRTAATATTVAAMVWLLFAYTHKTGSSWASWSLFAGTWLAFAAAAWLVRGVPKRAAALLILGGCLLGGIAAASAAPRQSDDLYRYVWDGQVQAAGIDPYAYVPAAPQLAALRQDSFLWPTRPTSWCVAPGTKDPDQPGDLVPGCTLINRPGVHTIYPPVAEAYFYAVDGLSPHGSRYKPMQLAAALLALATAAALLLGLRSLGRDPRTAALWAWCPVVLFESGNGAHIDVLAAFFTVCALVVLARDRGVPGRGAAARILGGVLLGLAIGAKLTPALAAPAALRRRTLTAGTAAAATFALTYLPHVFAVGGKVIGYIPGYLNEQGYDSGRGFLLLSMILPQSLCAAAAVLITAAAALAVYFLGDPVRPWRGALLMTGLVLFLTTPGYGWYSVLLCALVALDGSVEWLALALTTYVTQAGNTAWLSSLAAQRTGYVVAAVVVASGWALRERRRREQVAGDASGISVTADPAPIPAAYRTPLVDVVLPCLDEAAALPYILGRLPDGYRAIVVDNGSTDGSAEIAAGLGAHVVAESRKGFGAACHAGLLAASAPVVCFCDCDGSFDPGQLPRVADPVLLGEADLVLGRRRPLTSGAWPIHARVANEFLAFRLRRTGVRVRDLGPMRAARREALLGLEVADRRSGYPLETVLKASAAGWKIAETSVDYAPRTGKSKVTGTVSGTVKAVRDMTRVWNEATR